MMLADFHIHSTFSDGKLSIPELVDLYGRKGFAAIAITDHLCEEKSLLGRAAHYLHQTLTPASFPIYREIIKSEAERAWDQYGMILIPGFEITKNTITNDRSAHFIGLGIDQYVSAEGDVVEIAQRIRSLGGLTIAAHPVSTRKLEKQTFFLWDRREELRETFDAWEVASGPILFDEVIKAKLPMIANSDLHHPKQMTSWKTVLDCERHPEAILSEIKNQRLEFRFYSEVSREQSHQWNTPGPMGNGLLSDSLGDLAFG